MSPPWAQGVVPTSREPLFLNQLVQVQLLLKPRSEPPFQLNHGPTGTYSPSEKDLASRESNVVERHEEPVVAKTARATEEVVVSRDVSERTETVRDTVKETKVEVGRPDL